MYVKLATPPRALVVVGPASVTKLHILRLSHKPEIPEGLSCKAAAPSPSSSDGSFAMSTGPGTKFAAVTEPGSITKRSLDKAVDLTGRTYTNKAFDLEAPSFATLGSGRIICPPPSAPPHIPNSNYPRDYDSTKQPRLQHSLFPRERSALTIRLRAAATLRRAGRLSSSSGAPGAASRAGPSSTARPGI